MHFSIGQITVYSPLAVRLMTESELRTDGVSPCVLRTATDVEESKVRKERYSCIMYIGYLL